ncbi:MAG: OmpA family protein, partial [Candidatus Omnitrophica bacterium]|nr:OmpA family protein [Candidatus Omnitrophota bacterium]
LTQERVDNMVLGSLQQSHGFSGGGRVELYAQRVTSLLTTNQQLEKKQGSRGYISDDFKKNKLIEMTLRMREKLRGTGMYDYVNVAHLQKGLCIRIQNAALFNPECAELTADAMMVLREVVNILQYLPNKVYVEGHADRAEEVADPWKVSAQRAAAVAQFLSENGVERGRVGAVPCAVYQPLVAGDSEAMQAVNRRVEIIIKPLAVE